MVLRWSNWALVIYFAVAAVSATEIYRLEGDCFVNGRNESFSAVHNCDSSTKAGVCLCCEK